MVATIGPLLLLLCVLAIVGAVELGTRFTALGGVADRLSSQQGTWWVIIFGALLMHVVGLVDDRKPLPAWPKLLVQFLVALAVVFVAELRLLTVLDSFGPLGTAVSGLLTVFWIVVVTNAINFMDNMD